MAILSIGINGRNYWYHKCLFRNGINKNIALKMGLPAIAFVILGAVCSDLSKGNNFKIFYGMSILLVPSKITNLLDRKFEMPF